MRFSPFGLRKRIRRYITEKKEKADYRILTDEEETDHVLEKISYDINPFSHASTKDEKYVEDINVTYAGYFEKSVPVHYIARYPYINYKTRKTIINELIARWETDYYRTLDARLKRIFEQASFNPVKNVKRIKNRTINGYIIGAIVFLFLLKQYSFLQSVPYIGAVFARINRLLIYERYYNIASVIVYLAIFISMYLIIVKVYFDKVLQYGINAKGFLIKERDRMLRKFRPNIKTIRKHLLKIAKSHRIQDKYPLKELYNSKTVIKRIERFGQNIIWRVGIFISYYKNILIISKVLAFVYYGLIIYLVIALVFVNRLLFW